MVNMMRSIPPDSPDHRDLCQPIDCSFTKVIAIKVGQSFVYAAKTKDFGHRKKEKPSDDVLAGIWVPGVPRGRTREFTLQELRKATNGFSSHREIGAGGFGVIYRGRLVDGTLVAIKVLSRDSGQGMEQFQAEIRVGGMITTGSHPNLMQVIGYHCSSTKKKTKAMIVYPFMANGSVASYLGDHKPSRIIPFDWSTRKRIILGLARGLSHLHELGIVHRDVKPTNVLLDENFEAHLGDFGLARGMDIRCRNYAVVEIPDEVDGDFSITHQLCGTIGYLAPEYCINGQYSKKSDVFAFGVTLIELVTGQSKWYLLGDNYRDWIVARAVQLYKNDGDITRIMHPSMSGQYDNSEADELIRLGLVCVQEDPKKRPLMPEVIGVVEGCSTALLQRWENYTLSRDPSFMEQREGSHCSYINITFVEPEELSGPR